MFIIKLLLLCSPVFVPQIVGGVIPSGLVMLNVSVRHWPQLVMLTCFCVVFVPIGPIVPELIIRFVTVIVLVLGPVMTKLSKSKRSCKRELVTQIFSDHIFCPPHLADVVSTWTDCCLASSSHWWAALKVGTVLAGGSTTINRHWLEKQQKILRYHNFFCLVFHQCRRLQNQPYLRLSKMPN